MVEMFLAPLPMVYTFRNLFVLQEYVLMLMTSTTETKFWILSYLNKVIVTINSVKFFLSFITDTQSWLLNTIFAYILFSINAYQNLYFMAI